MDEDTGMNRRDFLRAAGAGAGVVAASGAAAAQGNESGGGNASGGNASGGGGGGGGSGPIDYGGWLDGANGWEEGGTVDMRGKKKVTVQVGVGEGGLAFDPVAVHVDEGATIVWEWQSAGHNVAAQQGADFASDIQSSGTYEWKATGGPIVTYQCDPHAGQGMLGAIAIGSNVPRAAPTGPVKPAVSDGAKTLGIATIIAMVSTLGLAYFFIRYGGDYEQ
ncbi:plastocyanin/azurin family copper-binding protein [Halomarina pelagica]|uniref:plastocyanin/azurin family copper-binding protein n=1 Tax=Halomarina pelagica TaxID=2961599 RepID=UPI0020C2A4F5|nr:plastocyanin/azurin family copper-binding protein [Halomarina sp. BND7]